MSTYTYPDPAYGLMIAGETCLEEHQEQSLRTLAAEPVQFLHLTDGIRFLITEADGLVVRPGWENDQRAVLEVQVAKAFGLPVQTLIRWLTNLPLPLPAHTRNLVERTRSAHYAVEGNTVTDLSSGEVVFAAPAAAQTAAAGFADVVNLDDDDRGILHYDVHSENCENGQDHNWKVIDGAFGCLNCGAAA